MPPNMDGKRCASCFWSDLIVDAPTHEIYGLECRFHHSRIDFIDCWLYEQSRDKRMVACIVYRNAREDGWDSLYSKPYDPLTKEELEVYCDSQAF